MAAWIAYALLLAVLLGAAAWCAERAARLLRAPSRWIWTVALVASLALPLAITSVSLQLPAPGTAATRPQPVTLREQTAIRIPALEWLAATAAGGAGTGPAHPARDAMLRDAWIALSLALLVVLAVGAARVHQRRRAWQLQPVDGTEVWVAADTGPAIVGLLRPRIVIPAWLLQAPAECRRMVLAHEQSHLEAGDPQVLSVALCLLALMPWNLPLWWQWARLRRAIEVDCDARVIRRGFGEQQYGEALLLTAEHHSGLIGTVAAMAEPTSFLERRIRIMLHRPTGWCRTAALTLGCAAVALTAMAVEVSPPDPGAGAQTPQPGAQAAQAAHQIQLDPAVLEGYVGEYQLEANPALLFTVTRNGAQLSAKLTGQQAFEIYPSSSTEFFYKVVNAQLTFDPGSHGQAASLVLHQNGQNLKAVRVSAATAEQAGTQLAARVQSQTAAPGTEVALRAFLQSQIDGRPDYDRLSPALAAVAKQQMPKAQEMFKALGPIRSIQFVGVGTMGDDIYAVTHDKGIAQWHIALGPDGRIASLFGGPAP